ncbi:leucine-rich repeat and guanylate kinase domain-containing protein-like [Chelonus insularis]|uniref:leucine-rich repeat and guanylate kinase domain-containing protein-like n=1 Tax=Chelonus insularis TaxID=460826 RepID=UPI00158B7412|nr:leucine-rich repeat and guanylate kinase domain-containing protein-like [Chelonus insularis]
MISERKQKLLNDKWSRYAVDSSLWNDENAPVVKVKTLHLENLTDSELQGILSDRMIETYSTFLSTTPDTDRYTLTKCELRNLNLVDISILENYHYCQYLDLAHNNVKDLSILNKTPYLLYLNASHNKITNVSKFNPPWYLTYLNLSHNNIKSLRDFQEFWSIVRLDLSHNSIEKICGLQNLKHLRYLNLSYNVIEIVENLDDLNIQELNLEYNYIKKFTSMGLNDDTKIFKNLRTLLISHNRISSLKFFHNIHSLRLVDLKHNKISDLMELSHLSGSVYQVDLRGNGCTKWPNYKEVVLFCMPNVLFVDGAEITAAERVSAATTFDPPINLLASRGLTKLILLEQLNAPRIDNSIIPYDEVSPPLIILSGPSAVKKLTLALHIAEKISKKVQYCKSHTTREFSSSNEDSKGYHFVEREEFNEMARNGEFLTVEEFVGDSYGFHSNEIAGLRREWKIGITQLDLLASIQMKTRYPNSKIILVLTKDETIHQQWIEEKFRIFTWIKDSVENLWALTIGNRQSENHLKIMSSKLNLITGIIDDIINNINVDNNDMGVTTNISLPSHIMSPKILKKRRELAEEKRHIKFVEDEAYNDIPRNSSVNISETSSDLKVILDEQMNVMVDDEIMKRKRKRAKMLKRRAAQKLNSLNIVEDEESTSSEDSLHESFQRHAMMDDPKSLMNNYVKSILKSRQVYIDQHLNNPGFYSLVVKTENLVENIVIFFYNLKIF